MTQDAWKIPGGGNSFPFDNYGDFVAGIVFEFEPNLKQTDKDGKEKAFPGGQPMYMHRVGIHVTDSSNPAYKLGTDASVYLKGGAKLQVDGTGPTQAVVLAAIKATTGMNDLQPGAKLTIQYVAEGTSKDRMTQPPKYYRAWYEAPSMTVPTPGQPAPAPATPQASPGNVPAPGGTPPQGPTSAAPAGGPTPGSTPAVGTAATGPTPEEEEEAAALALLAEIEGATDDAWMSDPRVAPLRAKNVSDAMIRKVLKI